MTHDTVERKPQPPTIQPETIDSRYNVYKALSEGYRTIRGYEVLLWDDGGYGGLPRLRAVADHLSMRVSASAFKNLIALQDHEGTLTLFVHELPGDQVTPLGAQALALWSVFDPGSETVYFADEDDLRHDWTRDVLLLRPEQPYKPDDTKLPF
jgi:hypothetical protein